MFKNRAIQVKVVKNDAAPVTSHEPFVLDLTQITSEEARKAFVCCFAAYASVKLLNTACKVAVIAASK